MTGARAWMLGALALTASAASAAPDAKLSVGDYIALRELIATYPDKIDHCTNSGYDYADLYSADGSFGVSSAWGDAGKSWYRGRDQLADAAGGGPGGCRPDPWGGNGKAHHHIIANVLVEAAPGGAKAVSTLISLGSGDAQNPPRIEWQGGYEDRFVKTNRGWRFLSRRHVWPGHDWPDTAAQQQALMKAAATDPQR